MSINDTSTKLAPFTPSGDGVLKETLSLLEVKPEDVFFDLGCGDGRIVVYIAKLSGARCIGVEYNEELVQKARQNVKDNEVEDRVEIIHGDALKVDLSTATVVFLYLTPTGIKLMLPKLEELSARNVPIVTYIFTIPGWTPIETRDYKGTKINLYKSIDEDYNVLEMEDHTN